MVGIDRKNENSAAARVLTPQHQRADNGRPRPRNPGDHRQTLDEPDRQRLAKRHGIASSCTGCGCNTVHKQQHNPTQINMTAISIGVSNSTVLMKSCAKTPITTAGKNAKAPTR